MMMDRCTLCGLNYATEAANVGGVALMVCRTCMEMRDLSPIVSPCPPESLYDAWSCLESAKDALVDASCRLSRYSEGDWQDLADLKTGIDDVVELLAEAMRKAHEVKKTADAEKPEAEF